VLLLYGGLAEKAGELVELRFPEAAVLLHPPRRIAQRIGVEAAPPHAPVAANRGQPRALEHAQVLGHGGQRHRERLREIADRGIAPGEPRQNRPSRRVRQRGKGQIERAAASRL
jgi:hypothetical protein